MKARNREINVFSMSALDLFASALGAFILIAIVLMPYFLRMDPDTVERLRNSLAEAQAERDATQAALEAMAEQAGEARQCTAALERCEAISSRTVLIVAMSWSGGGQDVDLHVVDPSGTRFGFDAPTHAGRPGELSVDNTVGPGVEIWDLVDAPAGEYEVYFSVFSWGQVRACGSQCGQQASGPAEVEGFVFHRNGKVRLRRRVLNQISHWPDAVLAARITVTDEGEVIVDET